MRLLSEADKKLLSDNVALTVLMRASREGRADLRLQLESGAQNVADSDGVTVEVLTFPLADAQHRQVVNQERRRLDGGMWKRR